MGSDIGRRMVHGTFWQLTGTALAKVCVVLAGIVCARILGKEIYGQYGMIKQTLAMITLVGSGGLGLTATKYISEYRKEHPERVSSIYYISNGFAALMGVIITILVYVFSHWIAVRFLNSESLTLPLRYASLIFLFVVLNLAQEGVLAGFEDFKSRSINTFIGNFLQALAMIMGAYYWGLLGALLGYGIGFLIIAILNHRSIHLDLSKNRIVLCLKDVRLSDFKLLLTYSLPATLSTLLAAPTYLLVRKILLDHSGYTIMADYDVADQWRYFILFVPTAIVQILMPIFSSISGRGDGKFFRVLHVNIMLNAAVTALMALFLTLLSGVILSFYGKDFNDTATMVVMAFSTIFTSVSSVIGTAISSKAHMWEWCGFNCLWASVLLGFAWLLSPMLGALGCALAILLSFVEHSLVQYIYVRLVIKKQEINHSNQ